MIRITVTVLITIVIVYSNAHEKRPDIIYILQWTPRKTEPFNVMERGQDAFLFRDCEYINCFITDDRNYFKDVRYFDAILFNAVDIRTYLPVTLPRKRAKYQKYVFVSTESAANYPGSADYNGLFNWTWTYKLNSDISYSYIVVKNRHGAIIGPREEMHWMDVNKMKPTSKYVKSKLRRKNKAVAWFVSNCLTMSDRLEYADQLQKALSNYSQVLDIYGECGDFTCPLDGLFDGCYALIEQDYYFYLAFENSFSEDYVTEKLLTALEHFAVPIVYGGANYTRFMPDGVYLNARTLAPAKLAKLINDAITNKTKYYDYFKWRRHYGFHDSRENPRTDPICNFCAAMNNEAKRSERTVLVDFEKWWNKPSVYYDQETTTSAGLSNLTVH